MEDSPIVLKRIVQAAGIFLAVFSAVSLFWLIPQTKQLNTKVAVIFILVNVLVACYLIYVSYILIRNFSPRAVQHFSAILSLMLIGSIFNSLKTFNDYWGPFVASIIPAFSLPLLWVLYRLCTKGLQKYFWDANLNDKNKTQSI